MSFNIGLSGLRTTNQSLNTISHNIANVSTAGFKAGRAEFSAVYSGGQAGGVEVARVSQNFDTDGPMEYTGRSLDLAISGRGFFMVNQGGQVGYTRAGTFSKDAENFIISSSGARLQGYATDANGDLLNGVIGDLRVSTANLPAQASSRYEFEANLKADATTIDVTDPGYAFDPADANTYNFSYSGKLYDSLGTEHHMTQYFIKTDANQWQVRYSINGDAVMAGGVPQVETLTFNTNGSLAAPIAAIQLDFAPDGADPMTISLTMAGTSQYASEFNVSTNVADGYGAGELAGIRVDSDGSLFAVYTNSQSLLQGRLVLADFANPDGMTKGDNTTWHESFASGTASIGVPGAGTLGSLSVGGYEGSNVELTGELVNLMTAQRNYQANAKSISTADKMTQVLFNSI